MTASIKGGALRGASGPITITITPGETTAALADLIAHRLEQLDDELQAYRQLLTERTELQAMLKHGPIAAGRAAAVRNARLRAGATWQTLADRFGYAHAGTARAAALRAARSEDEEQRLCGRPTRQEFEEDVAAGVASPYGPLPNSPPRKLNGATAETSPICGDCGAIRSGNGNACQACGSTQPPDLRRMNPRAKRLIGEAPLR